MRIQYGLDRFSEDLDFTLLKKNKRFDLTKYANAIKHELESHDIETVIEKKVKSVETPIESAFV